jgi:F-type H+-transporting ATPase subunit a
MVSFSFIAAGIPLSAPNFSEEHLHVDFLEWLTNSLVATFIVVAAVVYWARQATKKMELIPGPSQNLFEAVIVALHEMLEGIVGKHMINRVFSLLATLFIFILIANWFGLLPGVGSIGWGEKEPGFLPGYIPHVEVPVLRPTTADLNMTLGMAAVFTAMWLYWTIREIGVGGFINHTFGVKGGLKGIMALLLMPIFLFVGAIEVVSMAFRPVSLSLRLFGNVYAGETLLSTMITLGDTLGFPKWAAYLSSVVLPIPFYFLELLVGLLQAMVFTLLCAVYIQLSTSHDEEEAH